MTTAILYGTLCTAAYYLLARAKITEALWSRYPSWLDYWLTCAACSGFWYGLGCGVLGSYLQLPLLGLAPDHWLTFVAAGALGMVWTPVLAYAMTYAWERLLPGAEYEVEDDDPPDLRAV